jgi:hypothetical protein
VVINVAGEPEHEDETACSLQFGQRMTAVRNAAVKVVGTDIGAERAGAAARARMLEAQLRTMEAAGSGGGFVEGAAKGTRLLLEENMEKHAAARQRFERLRVETAEAPRGTAGRADLERRLKEARVTEMNLADLVGRQKTIKKLWKEPSGPYLAIQAELRSLVSQLARVE